MTECADNIAALGKVNRQAIDKDVSLEDMIIKLDARMIAIEEKFVQMQGPERHDISTPLQKPEATNEQAMQGTPGFAQP